MQMMNYTPEQLKIVYNAGAKNFPFEKTLELISLLGNESARGLFNGSNVNSGPYAPYKRRGRPKLNKEAPNSVQKKGRKQRRGGLSESIVEFLKSKGAAGAHVKEIAGATKGSISSVTAWFYTTGKKHLKSKEIKKIAPATFAYSEKAA